MGGAPMIGYVEALAADIGVGIADAFYLDPTLCESSRITVTAGEPAASAGGCNTIWVWLERVEDILSVNPDTCITETVVSLAYRIDVCYEEQAEDQTDEQHLIPAECLYGLMSAVWCHLVALKDSGELMDLGQCENVVLLPLEVGQRQGGTVSATGGVSFSYNCV